MKGFTLLEVLVSVAIMAIVMAAIYGAYTSNLETIQAARQSGLVNQTARVIFDRMSKDIESAFLTEPGASDSEDGPRTGLLGEDQEIDGRPADRLNFTSLSHVPVGKSGLRADLCEIGYHLEEDAEEEGLIIFRRDRAVLDQDISAGGQPLELSRGVGGLDITYQDQEGDEFDTWDTLDGVHQGILPSLIKVTLTVMDQYGGEHTFRTSVHPALGGIVFKGGQNP